MNIPDSTPEWFALLKEEYQMHMDKAAKLKKIIDMTIGVLEDGGVSTPIRVESQALANLAQHPPIFPLPEMTRREKVIKVARENFGGKGFTSDMIADTLIKLGMVDTDREKTVKLVSAMLSEKNSKDFIRTDERINQKSIVYNLAARRLTPLQK